MAGRQPRRERLAHNALLYRSDDDLVQEISRFARAGQARGEPMLLAFSGPRLRGLRETLGSDRLLHFEDIQELAANPARFMPFLRQWVDDRQGPVRIAAEPLWPGREPHEAAEVIRHEALVNLALADAPAQTLCVYDAGALPGPLLAAVEQTHPGIREPGAGWRASASYTEPRELWESPRPALPEPKHPVELPVTEDLAQLRLQVESSDVLDSVPDERRPDLVLAISEAAANAIRYNAPPRILQMWRNGHRVVAEVSGRGWIEDPLSGRRRPGPRASHGWGLWVINQVCDLVELRQHHERVRLRMHMRCG